MISGSTEVHCLSGPACVLEQTRLWAESLLLMVLLPFLLGSGQGNIFDDSRVGKVLLDTASVFMVILFVRTV